MPPVRSLTLSSPGPWRGFEHQLVTAFRSPLQTGAQHMAEGSCQSGGRGQGGLLGSGQQQHQQERVCEPFPGDSSWETGIGGRVQYTEARVCVLVVWGRFG